MAGIHSRSSGYQRISEFALISASSPELKPRVRESGVRRQPSVVTNNSVGKLQAFFESTANRFKNWKKSLPERALNKSVAKANREISRGLSNRGNFKDVRQGLKRLINAAQKHSGKTGDSNEAAIVSSKLKEIASNAVKIKNIKYPVNNFQAFTDPTNKYISKHSDRNTLFHRMLTGLARIGIVSEDYKSSRENHIDNLDSKIQNSLISMKDSFLEEKKNLSEKNYRDGVSARSDGDYSSASRKLLEAARLGNTEAFPEIRSLAKSYMLGNDGVEQNKELAFEHYRACEALGDRKAIENLSFCYFHGVGVNREVRMAAELYSRAVKIDSGDALPDRVQIKSNLGVLHLTGYGVTKSLRLAHDLLKSAAEGKNPIAQAIMQEFDEIREHNHASERRSVSKDLQEAFNTVVDLAMDSDSADVLHFVGVAYYYGIGVTEEKDLAKTIFESAHLQTHPETVEFLNLVVNG